MYGPNAIPLLIECGFRASLPVGIAWATTRLPFRSSAATRHFIWASAITIALLLPLSMIVTPRWSVVTPAPLARLAPTTRIEAGPSTVRSVARTERIGLDAAGTPKNRRPGGLTPWIIATWIWTTGAAAVFGDVLLGHFAAWRLYRTTRKIHDAWIQDAELLTREAGFSGPLSVVESTAISAPVVLHLGRPI